MKIQRPKVIAIAAQIPRGLIWILMALTAAAAIALSFVCGIPN